MAWASAMSQRLSGRAASRVHTLSPDLIEMVAHALGSVKGRVLNRLARQTLALRVEREIRANTWQVQRSRAAVALTCAAAAQVRTPVSARCRTAAAIRRTLIPLTGCLPPLRTAGGGRGGGRASPLRGGRRHRRSNSRTADDPGHVSPAAAGDRTAALHCRVGGRRGGEAAARRGIDQGPGRNSPQTAATFTLMSGWNVPRTRLSWRAGRSQPSRRRRWRRGFRARWRVLPPSPPPPSARQSRYVHTHAVETLSRRNTCQGRVG